MASLAPNIGAYFIKRPMIADLLLISSLVTSPVNKSYPVSVPIQLNLATKSFSLNDRYNNSYVNEVYKYNILLTLKYMDPSNINKKLALISDIDQPFNFEFKLNPGEGFAFHDIVTAQYSGKIVKTTNAHFNFTEGFKSDGFLTGDGVCHLASLLNWVSKNAGLNTYAPSNHNFATIPDVPKEYGVAIFVKSSSNEGAYSNLYIVNNKTQPIRYIFDYGNQGKLTINIKEDFTF